MYVRKKKSSGELQALVREMNEVRNYLIDRGALIRHFNSKNHRNIDKECQYLESVTFEDYHDEYDRNGVANRVVGVKPVESWAIEPELYETERVKNTRFERFWMDLQERLSLYSVCQDVDEICGIGSFGVLFLGFDDGGSLETPVAKVNRDGEIVGLGGEKRLMYIRAFDEGSVTLDSQNTNPRSPRFTQPEFYNIKFFNPDADTPHISGSSDTKDRKVHWSRVIHVTDGAKKNPLFHAPRQKPVFNWLQDIKKVGGGSAEMYWQGALPTYSVEEIPEMAKFGGVNLDYDTIKGEIRKLVDGLQKFIALESMTVKSLAPNVVSPADFLAGLLQLITLTIGVPMRVFLGSEIGKMAAQEDVRSWNKRTRHRQVNHNERRILRPLANRLIAVKAMMKPRKDKYFVYWPDINTPTDKDRADIAMKKSTALMNYLIGQISKIMSPQRFFTSVMGFSQEEAEVAIAEAKEFGPIEPPQPTQNPVQGGKATPVGGSLNGRSR